MVTLSQENPWYTSGNLGTDVSFGEETSRGSGDWGVTCRGLAKFEDGSERIITFRVHAVDGDWAVGFDYDGRISIPKSEWEAGRRQ